jgi:hypothetical protein
MGAWARRGTRLAVHALAELLSLLGEPLARWDDWQMNHKEEDR